MGRGRFIPTAEQSFHHIMIRTAQQVFWLEEPEVKEIYIDLLDFYSKVYHVNTLGFSAMSNHVHVAIELNRPELDEEDVRRRHELAQTRLANPRKFQEAMAEHYHKRYTSLSWFMWQVNRGMAVAYNKMKGTKGHLWGSRFKNVVVEDGISLLNVLTYIEANAVRAGIVDDPVEFPYCSVARIKKQLDEGKTPEAPAISLLNKLEKEIRAKTYVDWIRYAALALIDPELREQGLPLQFTANGWSFDMKTVCEALETRSPANWSSPVYGSASFVDKMLIDAGWKPPRRSREAGPLGPGGKAA